MEKMSAEDYRAKSDSIEEMLSRKDFFNEYIDHVIRKNDKNKNNCIDMDELFETFKEFNTQKIKLPITSDTVGKIMKFMIKIKTELYQKKSSRRILRKCYINFLKFAKLEQCSWNNKVKTLIIIQHHLIQY